MKYYSFKDAHKTSLTHQLFYTNCKISRLILRRVKINCYQINFWFLKLWFVFRIRKAIYRHSKHNKLFKPFFNFYLRRCLANRDKLFTQ